MIAGHLTIQLKEAELTRDTELFGEMDPFTVFRYRDQKQKSKVLDEAGKKPKWENQEFEFEIVDEIDQIEMTVFDEDVTCNDLVGSTFLQVGNLIINNGVDQWFEIYYKQKSAG